MNDIKGSGFIRIKLKKQFLDKNNMIDILYPVPIESLEGIITSSNDIDFSFLLFWLLEYTSTSNDDEEELEMSIIRLSELLMSDVKKTEGYIYTDDFYINISAIDFSKEMITINQGDKLLVAIQPTDEFRINISVFHALNARVIKQLMDLGKNPNPTTNEVSLRENNWEYALDQAGLVTAAFYAEIRGDSYLTYWKNGLIVELDKNKENYQFNRYLCCKPFPPYIVAAQIGTYYQLMN